MIDKAKVTATSIYPIRISEYPRDKYVVPAIDLRKRNGYTMWQRVMDHYGPGEHTGRLAKLDGTFVEVHFNWAGWGERAEFERAQREAAPYSPPRDKTKRWKS